MNQEISEIVELERVRMESFALASNASTSPGYMKQLFAQRDKERREELSAEAEELRDRLGIDEEEQEDVWVTPESIEDFLGQIEDLPELEA